MGKPTINSYTLMNTPDLSIVKNLEKLWIDTPENDILKTSGFIFMNDGLGRNSVFKVPKRAILRFFNNDDSNIENNLLPIKITNRSSGDIVEVEYTQFKYGNSFIVIYESRNYHNELSFTGSHSANYMIGVIY